MGDVRQLALIPLRDVVLCPGSEMPIYVGREATILAIRFAKAQHKGNVAVFSQVKAETNGPIGASDLYQVGTIAKIAASVEMTDQSIKGMLEGLERVRLERLVVVDGVTMVSVTSLPEANEAGTITGAEQAEILALLLAWCPDFDQACERAELETIRISRDLLPVVTALRSLIATPKLDKPGAERDWHVPAPPRHRELTNEAVAWRQKALEERSYGQKFKLLVEAIKFDVACRAESL